MNIEQAAEILRTFITTALLLVIPILGTGMVVGIIVSLFQSVSSIQEQTLTFIPKLIAISFVVIISAPWLMRVLMQFTISFLSRVPDMAR